MTTKLSYSHCSVFFKGFDNLTMNCPLCGVVIEDGVRHDCSKEESSKPKSKRKLSGQARKKAVNQ